MTGISKSFPGVMALKNVDFELRRGEVHALLGENGAGKSTLIKILGGIHRADEGSIEIEGRLVHFSGVHDAHQAGVSIIHQELFMVPELTVAENIALGREPMRQRIPFVVDNRRTLKEAQALLDSIGLDLRAESRVGDLSTAQQQMVEIAKAVSFDAKILVMDEPTSSLTAKETAVLYSLIDRLRSRLSMIYISHRLEELFRISDRVSILRDGAHVATRDTAKTTKGELIELMVGRKLSEFFSKSTIAPGKTMLEVSELCSGERVHNVSFRVRSGEILGIAGIVGAGRTELMRVICGIDPIESGQILVDGARVKIRKPQDAIANGIVMVPESRKEQGLILTRSVGYNITLQALGQFIKGIHVDSRREAALVEQYSTQLSIKTPSADVLIEKLSGGNQQKVVIAKWLATGPRVLILDEPTRGIDVRAKAEIYAIMDALARQGVAIIMISSELPEIINMSDRVLVMFAGKVAVELGRDQLTQEKIMHYATGEL
jgi:ABC-type sugar transport system ATPase subunit